MKEYFIVARTFAAPFFSETIETFVTAESPEEAVVSFVDSEPYGKVGIYAANVYASADAYHKGKDHLCQWLCNHEIEKQRITKSIRGGYSYFGHGPGDFEINGTRYKVKNPKGGSVQAAVAFGRACR